jgi:hypothetical protein
LFKVFLSWHLFSRRPTIPKRSVILLLSITLLAAPAAWAGVKVNTVPPPTPTTKLRLVVYLFSVASSEFRHGVKWPTSDEDYLANAINAIEKMGIYEVVSANDVKAAIGDQDISFRQMERNDWAVAREIGKGLHADFEMVITRTKQRGMQGIEIVFEAVMINTETGKNFKASYTARNVILSDVKELSQRNRQAFRTIFSLAKEDLLSTAVKKSRAYVPKSAAPPTKPIAAAPSQEPSKGAKKVLVYDFDSNEQYQTVAMILSEALREELLALKKFDLVDRGEMQKVRKNVAAQGTGAISDQQMAAIGKDVDADQVVTGHVGLDGKAFVVQVKRTGVETGATFGHASLTFKAGQEGDVMKRLPGFAKELMAL